MCDKTEQGFEDLKEFLYMVDFEQVDDDTVRIVPNLFKIKELPASVQVHLKKYFEYLNSIQ